MALFGNGDGEAREQRRAWWLALYRGAILLAVGGVAAAGWDIRDTLTRVETLVVSKFAETDDRLDDHAERLRWLERRWVSTPAP